MAVAKTPTLLSLDRFAQVMQINPLHFNGVVPSSSESVACGQPILQYDWQRADATSRESIASAIYDAEQLLATQLGFNVAPRFEVDDRETLTRPYAPEWLSTSDLDLRWYGKSVKANRGYAISGGREAKTIIQAGAAVSYSDVDLDGYEETATIGPLATTVTDSSEIALYYPGKSGAAEWQIRPITVTLTGGQVTIVCGRHQLVKDTLFEPYGANRAVDGSEDTNFLTTVDVYRKYLDPQSQAELVWEPVSGCGCGGSCSSCEYTTQTGCMHIRDYRLGLFVVKPADWDATNSEFISTSYDVCSRIPDRVRMWYLAGWRDMTLSSPNTQMDRQFELAVARLAMSLLDRPICACENLKNTVSYWGEDLSLRNGQRDRSTSYQLTKSDLGNPFGPTRAGIAAWKLVQQYRLGEGGAFS